MPIDPEIWRKSLRENDIKTVSKHIHAGVDVNGLVRNVAPLRLAAMFGATEVVAALLAAGAEVEVVNEADTPLLAAARGGFVAIVELLLAHGADPFRCLPQHGDAATQAIIRGDKPSHLLVLDRLLAAGVDANQSSDGRCRLHAAARNKRLAGVVARLVAAGAEVNELDPHWSAAPLHIAVDADSATAIADLLAAGADPHLKAPPSNAAWSEKTPLEFAQAAHKKMAPLLQKESAIVKKNVSRRAAAASKAPAEPVAKSPVKLLSVTAAWEQIEASVQHQPKLFKSLLPGADAEQLKPLAALLGVKLPADVVRHFEQHNGQKRPQALVPAGIHFREPFRLLSIAECVRELKGMNQLRKGGDFADLAAVPDPGVRADWWNPHWLPLAANGLGDLLCTDFAPAAGGTKTQIITVFHENGRRIRLAGSLKEWLNLLLSELQDE